MASRAAGRRAAATRPSPTPRPRGRIKRQSTPNAARHEVYLELYALYRELHDAFGTKAWSGSLYNVMKDLLAVKDRQRR
jgi:hypothetical protein